MKLLNVGCGGHRPQDEFWWNLDCLRQSLKEGTPERTNLDAEARYVECNLVIDEIPFPGETFDGILIQHVLEHFTCHDCVQVLEDCRNVLKPGGVLLASVPDAEYFLRVYEYDTRDRAVELFGEPISESEHESFFSYALWHREHRVIFNEASLRCTLIRAGFDPLKILKLLENDVHLPLTEIQQQLNRRKFSLILCATK